VIWRRFLPAAIILSFLFSLGCAGRRSSAPPVSMIQPPTALTYPTVTCIYTPGVSISTNSPSVGGGEVTAYTISPALPAGLSLNSITGEISGTPTVQTAAAYYNVTASNRAGSTTAMISIAVLDLPPSKPLVVLSPYVSEGKNNLVASTQDQGAGATYVWTLGGGVITSGQGTRTISFTAGQVGALGASVTVSTGGGSKVGYSDAQIVPLPDASMVVPASVHPGDRIKAALLPQPGMTYEWSVFIVSADGSITSGQGTDSIYLSAGKTLGSFEVRVIVRNQAGDSATSVKVVTVETGTWIATSDSLIGQCNGTATELQNGKILFAGGYFVNGSKSIRAPTAAAAIYDPMTDTWISASDMTVARTNHTATLLPNGKVLVTGGLQGYAQDFDRTAEIYDPSADRWTSASPMGVNHFNHTATLLFDGRVLIAGGGVNDGRVLEESHLPSAYAEIYDPLTDTWTPTASFMGVRRFGHTATMLPDGRVLVAGGLSIEQNPKGLISSEIFSPLTGNWSSAKDMIKERFEHTATLLLNGKVLIAGGDGPSGVTTSAETYDPSTGEWVAAENMITAHCLHSSTLLPDGNILIAGGCSNKIKQNFTTTETFSSVAELYDTSSGHWIQTGSLGWARSRHTASLLSTGRVLVGGGIGPVIYDYHDGSIWTYISTIFTSEIYAPR